MFYTLFYLYITGIPLAYCATVALIFLGLDWGPLPRYYLKLVSLIQGLFPKPTPENKENKAQKRGRDNIRTTADQVAAVRLQNIIENDLAPCFSPASTLRETLLGMLPDKSWTIFQKLIFFIGVWFRVFCLGPVRFALLVTSFVYVAAEGFWCSLKPYSMEHKTSVAIRYCRLFCASMGLVATYRNPINRPKKPGVAVANHMTPNDIQILFAGTPHGSSYGYTVTGQKHTGIIWLIERLVEKLCPSLWLERKCDKDRQGFLEEVLKIAKREGPVLLFPEGYCSNNSKVLQFRKAIFKENVNIYPIAVKQNPEFGDGFWYEDQFYQYLFRVFFNWAVVYDIEYLPMETKQENEDNAMFAARVQNIIAEAAGIPSCEYGGTLWYKPEERSKLQEAFRAEIEAKRDQEVLDEEPIHDDQYREMITVKS